MLYLSLTIDVALLCACIYLIRRYRKYWEPTILFGLAFLLTIAHFIHKLNILWQPN